LDRKEVKELADAVAPPPEDVRSMDEANQLKKKRRLRNPPGEFFPEGPGGLPLLPPLDPVANGFIPIQFNMTFSKQ